MSLSIIEKKLYDLENINKEDFGQIDNLRFTINNLKEKISNIDNDSNVNKNEL
jgi:hypothetical protein